MQSRKGKMNQNELKSERVTAEKTEKGLLFNSFVLLVR